MENNQQSLSGNPNQQEAPAQFQSYQPPLQPPAQPQPQFQPQGVPAEVPSQGAGKILGILSVILGSLSIIGTIFTAPFGIIFGALSISRGEKILGIIGISLSVAFMIFGLVLGLIWMKIDPEAAGMFLFNPFLF
jgi:hypothetical protein